MGMTESSPQPSLLEQRLAHIPAGALDFTPVRRRGRRDGWSARLQILFVKCLAAGLGVSDAAAVLGRSRQSAYALRAGPGAGSFASAWDRALLYNRQRPPPPGPGARERAVHGLLVPVVYRGKVVGHRRIFRDRLLLNLLRAHYARRASERRGA